MPPRVFMFLMNERRPIYASLNNYHLFQRKMKKRKDKKMGSKLQFKIDAALSDNSLSLIIELFSTFSSFSVPSTL